MDLRWDRHISAGVAARKNAPERIRDKDNHAWDATAYVMDSNVAPYSSPSRPRPGAWTFGGAVDDLRHKTMKERGRNVGIKVY
jgi:hypothetical protein